MSAQSGKKKRIGSRRRVANQNKTSEAEEFHITDSTSLAQPFISGGNSDSLNVFDNSNNSQSETQKPPSPELPVNRRKLGSSRRNKGEQHVKESELYLRSREEDEEQTKGNETEKTIQPQRQEELSKWTEPATHDSSVLANTPDYSSEICNSTTTISPNMDLESFLPKSENLLADKDEISTDDKVASDSFKLVEAKYGGTDKTDTLQSEELLENAETFGISELTTASVTVKEDKEGDEGKDLLKQDGNLQGNYVVSESHLELQDVEFSITAEVTTDKSSPRENIGLEYSVGQAAFSSSKEKLQIDEEKNEDLNVSEVKVSQHSEDAVNKVHKQEANPTEMREINHSPDRVTQGENSEVIAVYLTDKADVSDTHQSESMVESADDSAAKQEDSDDKQDEHPTNQDDLKALEQTHMDTKIPQISGIQQVHGVLGQVYEVEGQVEDDIMPSAEQTDHQEKEGLISEMEESDSSSQTVQSEIHAPFHSQPLQNNTDSHPLGSRRKLGSSRRHKGRQHAKDSVAESYHEEKDEVVESIRGEEALETTQMLAAIERMSQGGFSQGSDDDIDMPTTHDRSLYADIMPDYSSEVHNMNTSNYQETDLESLTPKSENLQEDDNERESDFKVSGESVGDRLEEMDKLDTVQSQEVRPPQHSEDSGNKVHEQELNLTQMHETDRSSESVTLSDNLTDQAEDSDTNQSELIVESTDDSATKQEDSIPDDKQGVHPAKEDILEASKQTNEDNNVYDTKQIHIDDIERLDTALAQVYEIEGRLENDVKPSTEQSVLQEKEGHSSEDEEDRSSQTLPSEIYPPSDSQPQQSDTNFKPIANRRKLGSSRRIKGRQQAKDSAAESYHRPTEEVVGHTEDNESIQTTKMSFTTETAMQEKSVETIQEGIDKCDTTQTGELRQNAYIGISQLTASNVLFSTAGQQLIDQSNSTKMPEELPNVYSVTEKESKGEAEYTKLRQDGNLQDNFLERESHLRSEDMEYFITAKIATEYNSSRERTESQYTVEQAIVSSPKEELSTRGETIEHFNLHEVKVAQHSDNAVHKHEVKPTEMHEIDHYSDNVTHDATEKSEIISGNLIDKAEVSNTNQSESMLESTDDSATKQEDSDPDDKQDEHPTKQEDFKALEQTRVDTKIPQISGIQQVHGVLGQVYEVEGQVEDDIMPSAEQTDHQEKEGLISEMEESDSSSQTVQSEIHAPFHSQPQQNNTDSHPLGSRRKLGSSRRHKGRQHAKDSVAESYHEEKDEVVESIRGEEALETTQMQVAIERMSQEEFSQGSENDIDMPTRHDGSLYADIMQDYSSEVQNLNTSNYQETDLESLTPKSENLQEDDNERESDFKVSGESVGDRLVEMDKLDTVHTQEVRAAQHSEDSGNKVHEQELNLTQMHETDRSSESVTLSDNLTDQAEDSDTNQSELIVESTDDSATKQEDSIPDDKQGVHPAKEDILEASKQTNEDNNVYDTKQIHIDDIERLDTALSQVYEIEGRLENDVKLSTEQSVLQEKEGHSSEDEEDRSSQTLPSEIYPSSDSQPQQSDTNFKPIANRRKLVSSHRIKGRQQAKDSAAESYHRPTEEVVGHTEDNESIQTTKMSFTTETAMQEKSVETIQEGIDKCDTTQTGELRQNAHIGISQLTASNVLFSTAGQQLIDQSNSTKMPEELPNVYSVTEKESKDEAEYTKLRQDGNLQDNFLERESHLRSEDMEYFITAKIATEYNSSRERTESQYTVEQAIVSSPKEELSTRGETIEHFNLHEVKVAQHSDDAVHKHEVKPTEMHEIAHYSDNVTHDATEKSEIISGNLIDKAEVSNTNQSESMLESTDDSATKQEDSDPDDKQDEHPTKQEDFKALEQTRVDTKIPQISGIQQVHGVLGQVYEVEGQVEDDIMPSAEQTDHQKEGLISEMEESDSSSQTVQSEIHAPFHSQPQQNNTDSHPLGSRRKLGSSRRHKGRQHAKDSVAESYHEEKDEVVESIRGEEALETTQMLAAIERMSQEEFSQGSENDIDMPTRHDGSLYADIMQDYSSEVQNLNTSNYQETDLESLTPKSENLQEDDNERESDFKVSGESVGDRLVEMDKLDTVHTQEVRAAQHSEDSGNKVHEQELNLTQMHETDRSSESVTLSDNLTDQAEDSDTNQSELIVESTDDSATKQEDSIPDDKQGVHPAKEDILEASKQTNEDNNVYDTKQIHIDDIERLDTALAQVYEIEGRLEDDVKPSTEQSVLQEKEGHSSEDEEDRSSQTLPSEIYPSSDSQPQQSDTNFKPIANRRKLVSSHRIKGRQQAKDSAAESYHRPTEEVVGHTEDNESIQTTKMSFTTETAMQEKSVETIQEGIDKCDTTQTGELRQNAHIGISQLTASNVLFSTAGQQLIDQSNSTKMPEELPNVYSVTEKESKDEAEYTKLRQDGNLQDNFLERESHLRSEDMEYFITAKIATEYNSSRERTESQYTVEQAIVSSPKEELSTRGETIEHFNLHEVKVAQHSDDAVHKHEVKPTEMHEIAHYSDNVTHDATEKSEIISGNLIDKAEVSNTNQSESMLESTDDSATKQEDSDPDDKQDEHPTKQEDFKALEQTRVDTKIPQISGIQQVHGVLGQVYEVEGQVEDDIMPSAEQTDHQEKEGLISEMEESDSSSQTVQSEIHAPFHSQPQQNNTDSHPLGSRRKLGSSRRHKGRQHAKDSVAESYHEEKDEVVESIRGEEALETTQMLAAIERMSQGGFSQGSDNDIDMPTTHDRSLYADIMPDYSSDVHNMNTSNYQETDLESLTPKSENLQEDDDERESDFKVSGESVGDRLEEMDKLDTVQSQEVRAAQHSEDSGNKVHEQELNLTQMHETDRSSESVTLSDNLTDQAEDSDTNQSELIVESTDDSATKQEDSNPDDKQGVHPAKEDNLEASEQTNEDNDVYDTKQIHIDDIERVYTALAQVYEIEGRLEDDVKLSTEQSVLQEKEGHSSEDEEDRSSKTLPSEIYPPSDSQPQQSDTNFKPIGNRRKLGSSRRIKGRQQAKDSAAESYHRPTEEVVGHTEDNESIQTTKMSFTTETAMQEKSVETIQEGIDKCDTTQTGELRQNAHIGISQLTASNVLFSTAGQQLIDQSNSTKMPEELPDVYSVTEKESKDEAEYTKLRQDGNLQDNFLERESHLRSEDMEYFITAKIATEYNSSRECTESQYTVEQAIVSSPKEELSTRGETIEHFNLHEVKVAQHSDDAVHKHEVKPTEMHEIAHYSDNVTHDATEKSEIISGNLIDKAEVSNTNQSESMLESTDDSATKQEDSDPDDKQDEHPTKQEDFKALEQTRVDTKIPQISGIQQVHGVLGQVYEVEGQVEDDIMPSAEQTDHQKEGLISEMEESDSSSQTVQSEIHAPFHSQPLQNNTDSHPLGSRRKLGSSRRHKGRQHAKDSVAESYHEEKDEVVESIRGEEALETTQMQVAIERMSQEEFSQGSENDIDMPTRHDGSLYADIMQDYSSEVQNLNTSNYQETDLESLTPKSENLQEDDNERESDFKVSGESVGDRLEEMDKLDTVHTQEVRAAQHSEDSRNKVHEQELNLTQMHETDRSSESVTLDATEKSEIISDNLTDQAEVSDTIQSVLIVENTDDSATKQEDSNPDDKQGVHPAKEDNLEASEQTNEDNDVYDTKQIHIDDIERLDTALSQVYEIEDRLEDDVKPSTEQSVLQEKEGHSSEDEEDRSSKTLPSEIYPPSDSQPQQSDTNFKPIGNRRKLGSSRRIKGRQQAKDSAAESYHRPTEEVVGHTEDNESIQTTKMSFTTETAMQEKSVETIQEGIDTHAARTAQTEDVNDQVKENAAVGIFELTASSLHSSATVEELLVDHTRSMKMPEEERPNLYSVTKRKIKHKDKDTELLGQNENTENDLLRESHLREEAESSVTLEKDTEQHSLGEQTVIECSVDQAAFLSSKYVNESQKEHVSLSQVRGSPQSEDAVNEVHEELVNVRQVQEMHQIGFSSTEESESLQTLQSETNAPLDFQHQDNSLRREEQTHAGFKTTGNRRKLGSSRRNKGRQQVETSVAESSQDVVESRRSDGVLDPTKMSLAVETAKQEEVQKQADLDLRSVPKIRKIRSTVTDEDSTGTMLEKDTVLSQKIMDNSANVTTSVASSSSKDDAFNKDYNEEEKNVTKEPENLAPFIGHGAVKADLIPSPEDDSDIQNISYHDDYITTRPIALDVLEQEIMNMQQTNGATETVGDVTIKDCNTEAETSMDVHVFGERFKDPTKKDQEMNASQEFTHAEPFAAGHNKEDTSAPSSPKENFRAEPAMDVPEESRISTAVGVSDSQQGIQEKTQLDNSGNLQGKSKQKRRKLGSTRRTQLGRKPEEGMDDKDETKDRDDMRNLDEMEVMEVLPMSVTAEVSKNENTKPSLSTANKEEQEATETAAVPDKGQKLQSNNADMQGIQSYMISDIDYSKAIHPEQLASKNEVVNPIKFSHAADLRDSERNVDVNVEPSQLDDFTVSEMHVTSVYTHSDMERPEGVNVIQDQALESAEASAVAVANLEIVKSVVRGEVGEEQKHTQASVQELREVNEEAHNKNLEMRSTSPHRRRKMGSTRRNLGSRSKREDLLEKQDMDGEATATNVEESIKEKEEPQLETEDKDSENVESHFRPPSEQTFEENPVSHGQLVETEHQLTPSYLPVMPSSSPKPDVMSEAAGGRRRKMGSSRKSRGQQSNVSQTPEGDAVTDTQNGGDVASIIDEGVIKTAEEESFGLDRISEVDETAKKPSSNISTSKAGEHLKPVSEKTPAHVTTAQHAYAENRLSQEGQQRLSLGSSRGAASRSNRYNVLMVGDSSVGKTSFIKRAQSGKFSLDLPASVGIDSFMWTVVVDGKPVVLQLWDTAGQERFHSITRQIFHKAQAFLLMYDITSSQSFSAVSYWANCIQEGAAEDVTILLLGNKSDHAKRQIKFQEGEILAKEYNFEFMECSAATGENVIQSLETVARMLSQKVEPREETTVLHKEPQQKKSSGCC
ncbi:uncharacterized protein rab44 isoform X2 [Acanthopagrus latus]|uniref:uncharacterized protein rab44 isoform X2 n=1 Tax=Acanthopagrus latus TaxID=8177 RepID=UPI00187BD777|nr:uncharacterized protein rab44 isoform X2 [Acanthopagrus latus]